MYMYIYIYALYMKTNISKTFTNVYDFSIGKLFWIFSKL